MAAYKETFKSKKKLLERVRELRRDYFVNIEYINLEKFEVSYWRQFEEALRKDYESDKYMGD